MFNMKHIKSYSHEKINYNNSTYGCFSSSTVTVA